MEGRIIFIAIYGLLLCGATFSRNDQSAIYRPQSLEPEVAARRRLRMYGDNLNFWTSGFV